MTRKEVLYDVQVRVKNRRIRRSQGWTTLGDGKLLTKPQADNKWCELGNRLLIGLDFRIVVNKEEPINDTSSK